MSTDALKGELEGEEDMAVQARRLVDTDPSLQLRPSPPAGG